MRGAGACPYCIGVRGSRPAAAIPSAPISRRLRVGVGVGVRDTHEAEKLMGSRGEFGLLRCWLGRPQRQRESVV